MKMFMKRYNYKEYDENDMILLRESDSYPYKFCKIKFSIDYEYVTYIRGKVDFDYREIRKVSNARLDNIFEYWPDIGATIPDDIIWRE